MKIIAYKLIQAEGNRALAEEVNRFINEGWEPHGSPLLLLNHAVETHRKPVIAQAIVKTKQIEEALGEIVLRECEARDLADSAKKGVISAPEAIDHIWEVVK